MATIGNKGSKTTIEGVLTTGVKVAGPNGVHTISLDQGSQPSNMALSNSKRINCNTIIAALDHPKTYTYNLGGDRLDVSGISILLLDPQIRNEVISVMQDGVILGQIIEAISGARYGVFATGTDSISFEIARERIGQILGSRFQHETIYVVTNFFTPFRTILGLSATSYIIQKMVPKVSVYPSKEELIKDLELQMIESAINDVSFDFIKNDKSKMGVGDLTSKYERAFASLAIRFQNLAGIARKYEAVLALVRSYVLKDFSSYSPEELSFFEEERFLSLATNITIIKHALETTLTRPAIGYTFWLQSIESIGMGISSSNKYAVIELGTVREYYTITSTTDVRELKNGLVISKNLKENTNLRAYRSLPVTGNLTKLYEDKTVDSALGGIYSALATLDSSRIHKFVVDALQNAANPDSKYILYMMNLPQDELEYMAIVFAKGLLITTDSEEKGYSFIYEVDIKGSKIADELKTVFSYGLVTNPLVSLFYAPDYEGKRTITIDNHPISDTKNVLFTNSDDVLTKALGGKKTKFQFQTDKVKLTPEWDLAKLTGLIDLTDIRANSPIIGSVLFDQLVEAYNHINYFYSTLPTVSISSPNSPAYVANHDATLNRAFLSIIQNILTTKDIDHLLSSALAQLWAGGGLGTRFAASPLNDDRVKNELRVRLMIFVAGKLGFVHEGTGVTKLIDALSKSRAFDYLIVEGK